MNNLIGFLKWELRSCYKNIQLWYGLFLLIGIALVVNNYSWGAYLVIAVIIASMFDLLFLLVKLRYHTYLREQERIINELKQ